MSVDHAEQREGSQTVEAAQPGEAATKGRSVSLWFLVVPLALVLAIAAIAFFLLSPQDEDLMTTTDATATAVAVESARPAEPAFALESAAAPTAADQAAAEADPLDLNATDSEP